MSIKQSEPYYPEHRISKSVCYCKHIYHGYTTAHATIVHLCNNLCGLLYIYIVTYTSRGGTRLKIRGQGPDLLTFVDFPVYAALILLYNGYG